MPKLYLIAGHTQGKDEGAQNLKTKETENLIARNVLLQVFPRIKAQIRTELCPFTLTLEEQIRWVNKRATPNDFVVCCHLNSSPQRKETGALCFYYGGSEQSKKIADKFLKVYTQEIGLRNAGLLADTQSRFGRLGIIRDTKGWSFLLEMGSINNDIAVVKVRGAQALLKALQMLIGPAQTIKENKIKVIIQRPVEDVFEFTTNPKNTHLWIPSIQEETAEIYPPKIGTIYKNRGATSEWSSYKVTAYEKDSLFMLADEKDIYHVKYTYKKIDEGCTELEYFEWVKTGELKDPLNANTLTQLKHLLEKSFMQPVA